MTARSPDGVRRAPVVTDDVHAASERDDARCLGAGCPPSSYATSPAPTGRDEVHVVSVYEGPGSGFDAAGVFAEGAPIEVVVHPTRRPVHLVLTSSTSVTWRVTAERGAKVRAITIIDNGPSSGLETKLAARVTRARAADVVYQWESDEDSSDFGPFIRTVRKQVGAIETTFQGGYDGAAFTVPYARDLAAAREREASYRGAASLQQIEIPPDAELDAALAAAQCARPGADLCAGDFVLDDETLVDVRTGDSYPVPASYASMFPAAAMTIDRTRGRLVLATYGGDGGLFAFDLATHAWSALAPMRGLDVSAALHDPERDALWLVPSRFGHGTIDALIRSTPDGGRGSVLRLSPAIAIGAGRGRDGAPTIAMAGGMLVLEVAGARYVVDPGCGVVQRL